MNQSILIGRLTADPEVRHLTTTGTPVAKFNLAVDRDYKNKDGTVGTDFIPVEMMGKAAEFVINYIAKGRLVAVQGPIRVERYEKDGEKKTYTKVAGRQIKALDPKKKEPETASSDNFQAVDDDDVPF